VSLLQLFICAFMSLTLSAATFKVQSIAEQVQESEGIIIGHFLKKKSIKLENGMLATQMIFKMNKEFGLQSELFGQDEVIIHYPGGQVEDENVRIEGVPEFMSGEKVVLLIKSIDSRYWGLNLGLGTFKLINFGKETLLINTLFPSDVRVSQMRLEDFEKTIKKIKGHNLKVVDIPYEPIPELDRMPASVVEGKNRTLASKVEERENSSNMPSLSTFWLVVTFALLGGLFRFFRQHRSK